MTRTRISLAALGVLFVLGGGAGGYYWYAGLDAASGVSAVCVPEDATDRDKAGNVATVAVVTVDAHVANGGGVRLSRVTVHDVLKGDPGATLVIGQSVPVPGSHDDAFVPLAPGHRYVVGLKEATEYRDGWVWFATSADNDLTAARARWADAVAHQNPPRPDRRCDDRRVAP
ncbi:hypothetical protein AB0C77_27640 [Streptomyces sp. NPDC048629]|uniref:hypothetical protein n=1 Tax=Streptomyces sp. NPDC048629 TaxID=3154824 RepID=UPI0034384B2C